MTVIEMIRQVQRELRLPQSGTASEPHAKIILDYINKVQRSLMMESASWDELKVSGYFHTQANVGTYTISIINEGEVDVIRDMRIGTNPPLVHRTDEQFRELKRDYTTPGQPIYYRHFSREAGYLVAELIPVPDGVYRVDTEVLMKPPRLTMDNQEPMLDPDTIILGAIMLAKEGQGEDFAMAQAAFQAKLGLQIENSGESNWGDVEAV
jgi:hypothetical protein